MSWVWAVRWCWATPGAPRWRWPSPPPGRSWPPAELAEGGGGAVEEILAARPDVAVRWYESRHDVPLIRPAELAADVERTALAAVFASVAREASSLQGDWSRRVH